jgi:hypothetical protein
MLLLLIIAITGSTAMVWTLASLNVLSIQIYLIPISLSYFVSTSQYLNSYHPFIPVLTFLFLFFLLVLLIIFGLSYGLWSYNCISTSNALSTVQKMHLKILVSSISKVCSSVCIILHYNMYKSRWTKQQHVHQLYRVIKSRRLTPQ